MRDLVAVLLPGLFAVVTVACSGPGDAGNSNNAEPITLPRIAIAGLAIESSTFSPAQTHAKAFHAKRGDEVFDFYPFLSADSQMRAQAEWFPTLRGHALPGAGMVPGLQDASWMDCLLQAQSSLSAPLQVQFLFQHSAGVTKIQLRGARGFDSVND